MEDNRGEFFVFAAGYPDNMDVFLKANPGLRSRFDKVLKFEDYSPEELLAISLSMIEQSGYRVQNPAKDLILEQVMEMYETRNKYFGNAREVRKMVLDIIKNQNLRCAQNDSQKSDNTIIDDDIKQVIAHSESDIFTKESIGFKK